MSRQLLIETVDFEPGSFVLEESTDGRLLMRGPFQRADEENANGRIYTRKLWERVLSSDKCKSRVEGRAMFGHLDHPPSSKTQLAETSHIVTDLTLNPDGTIEGEAEILDTPNGRTLRTLIESKCKVAVSSRGMGSVSKKTKEVQDDFSLETFDFVASPSTAGAYPQPTVPSKSAVREDDSVTEMTAEEAIDAIKTAKALTLQDPVTLSLDNGRKVERVSTLLENELLLSAIRSAGLAPEARAVAAEIQQQLRSARLSLEESLQASTQEGVKPDTGGTETMSTTAANLVDNTANAARLGILEHKNESLEGSVSALAEENESLAQHYDVALNMLEELKDRYKALFSHTSVVEQRLGASEGIINEFLEQTGDEEEGEEAPNKGPAESEGLTEEKFLAREASSVTLIETMMRRLRRSEDIIEQLIHRCVAGERLGNAFLRKMNREALAAAVEEAVAGLPGEEAQNKGRALLEGSTTVQEVQSRVDALLEAAEATVQGGRSHRRAPAREGLPTSESWQKVDSGQSQQLMESVAKTQPENSKRSPALDRARDLKNMLGGK